MSFIYIRTHESYDLYKVVKVGKTDNLYRRDSTYATGELKRGKFAVVYEFDENINEIEKNLKRHFSYLNQKHNGGTEFFKREIIDLLPDYFKKLRLSFKTFLENDIGQILCKNTGKISKNLSIVQEKNLLWGIKNNKICDYTLQVNNINVSLLNSFNNDLFLASISALYNISIGKVHHLLIYVNSISHSDKIMYYISLLLERRYFVVDDLFYDQYDSQVDTLTKVELIDIFKKSKCGIITCISIPERVKISVLDGVIFAEKMTSPSKILQSALKCFIKNNKEPNKIAKIILPVAGNIDDLDDNNKDFKKVKKIIYEITKKDKKALDKIKINNLSIREI
jgi:hypothetical protein